MSLKFSKKYIKDEETGAIRIETTLIPSLSPEALAITAELETYYDSIAQARQYDNRLTCALRAGYEGPFKEEGQKFASWMDSCNAYAYQVMQDCLDGKRQIPTTEELLAGLPKLAW